MNISFDNTETAYAYKTTKELKRAKFLYSMMRVGWLVKFGTAVTPWAINVGLPVKNLIRKTIFKQFVGGETLEETMNVVNRFQEFGVEVILDYGVEAKEGEENFNYTTDEILKVIRYAGSQPGIKYFSIKLTGYVRFGLLEKLNAASTIDGAVKGIIPVEVLSDEEKNEWQNVVDRVVKICETARDNNVGVLVDAEESWVQHPMDAITMQMMKRYNKEKIVVFNTLQMYRHDRLQFLKDSISEAIANNIVWGAKLVRGAYLEKERKRAKDRNYPSPIHQDKQSTDSDYDAAVEFCIQNLEKIHFMVGSHNEFSNLNAVELLEKYNLPHNHPNIYFSQLYGMKDNITFNLAKSGCPVGKLLPFGPLKDVIPYLMRRAQENSSLSGQTGRELDLIKRELKRRKGNKK